LARIKKSRAIEATARKPVNTIPVDFAARREAIRRACSKSIVESENLKRLRSGRPSKLVREAWMPLIGSESSKQDNVSNVFKS
jgi:hypothetical protein